MSDSPQPQQHEHPLAKRLREARITKAAIIDDVYDLPSMSDLDDVPAFWSSVEDNPVRLEKLHSLKPDILDETDIDEDLVKILWGKMDDWGELGKSCKEKLFAGKLQAQISPNALAGNLERLGIKTDLLGAEDDLPDPSVKLIFLDYALDPKEKGNLGRKAIEKAKELWKSADRNDGKPFIVLISNKPDAFESVNEFRDKSEILGGLFGYIPKEDLSDAEKLYLRLSSWGIGIPAYQQIQHFVDTLVESLDNISKSFKKRIRALEIQDYAFIQRLSLHEDGHPLGDYILWLFESTLGYQFRDDEKVREAKRNLDEIKFDSYLPCQNLPSGRLAEIYTYAVTEPAVEELGSHPLDESCTYPLLGLGDIFIRDRDMKVLMVINADCDLLFSPGSMKRRFNATQPIYFVPGKLEPIHLRNYKGDAIRTELFEYRGEPYRIIWDHKKVQSYNYGHVWPGLKGIGYSRSSRLRLPYALELQQKFAGDLVRVGIPVSPPFLSGADVEIYCKNENGKSRKIDPTIPGGAIIIHTKAKDYFTLTVDCVNAIFDRTDIIATAIASQCESIDKGDGNYEGKVRNILKDAEKVRTSKANGSIWQEITEKPFDLPAVGKKSSSDNGVFWIYREGNFSSDYTYRIPMVLNIRYGDYSWDAGNSDGET